MEGETLWKEKSCKASSTFGRKLISDKKRNKTMLSKYKQVSNFFAKDNKTKPKKSKAKKILEDFESKLSFNPKK